MFRENRFHRIGFNYENGTFLADNTKIEDNRYNIIIEESLYKKLNEIYNSSLDKMPLISFSKQEVYKTIGLFSKFFGYHTEKSLFLESLNLIY
jgi:deoxyhypusine synthase